ncbi:AfsR/SARP family transcriptional regulator [Streptomyces sp. PTD5-9]|uniref:AfsR/SARP family transcriptional regulator n=1 Tax=Streptomyces sp. PTD5-9 TaxID=3120150 RepID=UPI00300969D2
MRYSILGVTEARDPNGEVLPVGGTRLRALLAALALRVGRPVSVAVLVDDIWGDDPPYDAPAALQALVGRLRRALGRDAITRVRDGYRLEAAPDEVDLHVFERLFREGAEQLDAGDPTAAARTLRTALGLWRGPALADLPDGGHGQGHGLRPEARRLTALERRIEADLRCAETGGATGTGGHGAGTHVGAGGADAAFGTGLGPGPGSDSGLGSGTGPGSGLGSVFDSGSGVGLGSGSGSGTGPGALVPELRELTAAHPYNERFWGQLIRALRAEGRRADALAAYEEARHAFADGLGADPGPELAALHRELLGPSDAARTGPGRAAAPGAPPREVIPAARVPAPWAARAADSVPTAAHAAPAYADGSECAAAPAPAYATAPAPVRGNIRPRLTSFVGREAELDSIRDELTRARLVTLTGPGGSGKTRLAEEAATRASRPTPGRAAPSGPEPEAWIAELAPVEDPADVPGAVLSALGLRETTLLRDNVRDGQPARNDPTGTLVDHLAHRSRTRPVLLVLDNCEHVVDAAATLAEALLTRCPGLRVLATSREPLGVPGESIRPVGPLPADPAHRLFAERARAVRPDFDLGRETAHDPHAVAEICRRLDGLPLAIELAAARLRMLTPRQIADRLDDRFRLLTSGARTVLPRQQTLRAVVDWSWDLLDEDERTLLRQVSVFAGGWDLAAAEAVAGPLARHFTAQLTGSLVDKSLVVAAPTANGEMRYRLLETIHEYAVERAAETPALRAAAAAAHTAYFLALVEEAEPRLRSGEQLRWIERLETDLDNIRAALTRTVVTDPAEADAMRLVLGMGWFWWLRNYRTEGLGWTERAVTLGPEPVDRADPRYWPRMRVEVLRLFLAAEHRPADDIYRDDQRREWLERVTEAFRDSGPHGATFPGMLWPLATFTHRTTVETRDVVDAAVANTRVHGRSWEYGVMLMLRTHMVVDMPGGMPGVDGDLAELRELAHRVGDRWLRAQVASAAAEAGAVRGRYDEASAAYEEALLLAREVGAHVEAPFLLARLAELAYRTGDVAGFERLLTESENEADRLQVHDARAYAHFLRATLALDRGEIAEARRLMTETEAVIEQGSPPSHFTAVVRGLEARITAREQGPGHGPAAGVRGLSRVLREARDAQCAELVTGHLVDGVATVLPEVGRLPEAVRILAAADTWRPAGLRTVVQQAEADEIGRLARAELGAEAYESERAAGRTLTVDDVIELLTGIAAALPEDPGAPGVGTYAEAYGDMAAERGV